MNEQEAMQLRESITQAVSEIHVDIHWHKPAGTSEAIHTLWLWQNMTAHPVVLTSKAKVEQWIREQKGK